MAYIARSEYMDTVRAALLALMSAGQVPLLWGAPGTGKTAMIKSLAAQQDKHVEVVIGSTLQPTDFTGMPVRTPREDGTWMTQYGSPEWAHRAADAPNGAYVVLDEMNTAPPAVQAAELTFLQTKTLPMGITLPLGVSIIGACNSVEDAADGWDLAAPVANRLCHLTWNPPLEDWYRGASAAWGEPVSETEIAIRSLIVTFLRTFPNLVHKQPTNADEASKAWPSRRSWDNAAMAVAVAQIDGASEAVIQMILTGFVGVAAAAQFIVWQETANLPTPAQVLEDPSSIDWAHLPVDAVFGLLGGVMALGLPDQAEQVVDVWIDCATRGPVDAPAALVVDLLSSWPRGAKFPTRLVTPFQSILKTAGMI